MKREELDRHLVCEEQWGFIKETDDPDYLGWVLLSKRKPPPIPSFDPDKEPERYQRWLRKTEPMRQKPYIVSVLELRRDVHESGEYPNTGDYRLYEAYPFATLHEAEEFLRDLGYSLENIEFARELDAP